MGYFVTGATGLLGRLLVERLLAEREGPVHVLVEPSSRPRMEALLRSWGRPGRRVRIVDGDLAEATLGVDPAWVARHSGTVGQFFHLAGLRDLTASEDDVETLNVGGTRNALEVAADLDAGCFHHLSSVAVSGDHVGFWDETMVDVGQGQPSAYHRATLESELVVRSESAVPWRIYRPSLVLGDSRTGAMEEAFGGAGGAAYLFPLLRTMRDLLPSWTPLLGLDLGDTNLVPADYVAAAMDHLAHLPGHDGEVFHLVAREPQRVLDVVNTFAAAAGAPRFTIPVDREVTMRLPALLLPRALRPAALTRAAMRTPAGQVLLRETVGRLGIPPEVLAHVALPATYGSRSTDRALDGSGISVPDLGSYAARLWAYWEEQLDDSWLRDPRVVAAVQGRTVVVTGASSGIGRATALKTAQAGAVTLLVDSDEQATAAVRDAIEARGGRAFVHAGDVSDPDAAEELARRITTEHGPVDVLVNDASTTPTSGAGGDQGHAVEDIVRRRLFPAIRLATALLAGMRAQQHGRVLTLVPDVPREDGPQAAAGAAAAVAALKAWSVAVAAQVAADGVLVATLQVPAARQATTAEPAPGQHAVPRAAPSPAQVAERVVRTLAGRPGEEASAPTVVDRLARALQPAHGSSGAGPEIG